MKFWVSSLLIILILYIGYRIYKTGSDLKRQKLEIKQGNTEKSIITTEPSYIRFSGFTLKTFEQNPSRTLRDIAENLDSRAAFILAPSGSSENLWTISPSLLYAEDSLKEKLAQIKLAGNENLITTTLDQEIINLERVQNDTIPDLLISAGIHSLIAVSIGNIGEKALLVVCNKRTLRGQWPLQFRYAKADADLALVMGRALPVDTLTKILKGSLSS